MRDVNECNDRFVELLSEVANALQAATLLADLQRRKAGEMTRDAIILEAAIDRATRALRQLRPHVARRGRDETAMATVVTPE